MNIRRRVVLSVLVLNRLMVADQLLWAEPSIEIVGHILTAESVSPGDRLIDPEERVTFDIGLRNSGTTSASNLTVTLLTRGAVASPTGPQSYGALQANAGAVWRSFTFTAVGTIGAIGEATLRLQDGATDLGMIQWTFALGAATSFRNPTPLTIFSTNMVSAASVYPSSIAVSNLDGLVRKVTVTVQNLSHDWCNDLQMLLVGPTGQSALLMANVGGPYAAHDVTLTFDDDGPQTLKFRDPFNTGSYYLVSDQLVYPLLPPAPDLPYARALAIFANSGANGTWSLYVNDEGSGQGGLIEGGWSLTIYRIGSPQQGRLIVEKASNQRIKVTLIGAKQKVHWIEVSSDLKQWEVLGQVIPPITGTTTFFDSPSTQRYYRIRLDR